MNGFTLRLFGLILMCLITGLFPLIAQTSAADPSVLPTEAPSLELPDMDSEVRSVVPQDIIAPPPPLPSLPLPAISPELPLETELAIPESAYRTESTLETSARQELGETFTEAAVSAGLWSGIGASLSIYRPASNPAFSLAFSHTAIDGFAYHDAGEGFSERRTMLNTRIRGSVGEKASWSFAAAFADEAEGLQGQSIDFFGVSHRYFDILSSYKAPLGPLTLKAAADMKSASRSLELSRDNVAGTLGVQELAIQPKLGLEYSLGRLSLSWDASYSFRGLLGLDSGAVPEDRSSHRARTDLSALFSLSPAFTFGGSVAYLYTDDIPVLVPFSLSTEAALGDFAALSLKGGLASDTVYFSDEWKKNPYLDVGELPDDDVVWFVSALADVFSIPGLSLRFGADWGQSLDKGGRLVPLAPAAGSTRYLYGYVSDSYQSFSTSASARWRLGASSFEMGTASLGLSWFADWLDDPAKGASQKISTDLEYRERTEAFGAAVAASVGLDTSEELPLVDAHGFIRVSPGIRLLVDLNDILYAFKSSGRTLWAPYIEAGFNASIRLQFSF